MKKVRCNNQIFQKKRQDISCMGYTARIYMSQHHALATNRAQATLGTMKLIKGLQNDVMRDAQHLLIFMALHWTYSSMSLSLLYWGTPHCTPDVPHQCCGERKNLPQPASKASPNAAQDAVDLLGPMCTFLISLPHSVQPNSPYNFQQSCFPASQPPACPGRQGYSFLGTRIYISIC